MFSKFLHISSALILSLSITHVSYAGTTNASNKATATISSECTISAQNLNFGSLTLPLSSQSASSNMSVLCSNKASYSVGLAYGGVYGTTNRGNYYTSAGVSSQLSCGSTAATWTEYNSSGTYIGFACTTSATTPPSGYTTVVGGKNYNPSNATVYTYGKMTGVAKGDNVAYSIHIPNNPGQVWNTGNSSYSSTGTGATQTIPVDGSLVPAQSSSTYPAPDTYMDTVTATIDF